MKKSDWLVRARKDWAKFKSSNSAILNHMALEFERKKRAEQFKKTQFNNTGVIDTQSLHKFKWSENIFRKSESVSDGKNHGIIMLVDCSSSMAGTKYIDTIKQTILLTEFCRKVGIKYKVLGFNDCEPNNKYGIGDEQKYLNKKKYLKFKKYFNLREWLNSEMNKNDHEMMCSYLLMVSLGKSYDGFYNSGYASGSSYEKSSSKLAHQGDIPSSTTPLNDSILVLRQISLKFKEDFKIEVLNTVILTDGESNKSSLFDPKSKSPYDGHANMWRGNASRSVRVNSYDPLTGKYFRTKVLNTTTILNFYKKCVGGNIIGFFINGHNNEETKYNHAGYDAYFSVANFDMKSNIVDSSKNNRKKNLEKIKDKFTVDHNSLKYSKKILSEMIDFLS